MEPPRVPLLLRTFVVQRLRACDRRYARPAPAHCPGKLGRAEICSPLCHSAAGIKLGVPVARESNLLTAVIPSVSRGIPPRQL